MFDSGMVNKILKAKEYAAEPHRIQFSAFRVHFDGLNDGHTVEYDDGGWNCERANGSTRSSFHSTINVLEGLLEFERSTAGTPESQAAACACLLYTSPSPRDRTRSRMPSSA